MVVVSVEDKKYREKYGKMIEYYMDKRLKQRTDEKVIPALRQKDKDWIEVVDGGEGSGKSWFSFQRAKYIDPSFNLSRVVFTPDEFKEAIFKAKKFQAIVYDEAFTGLSSRSSLSPINRYLVSLMMQMRQKNLYVILVLPTFFLLDKYAALFRTRLLIHIYETKGGNRGYFRVYNAKKKKILFLMGRATYSYPKQVWTKFKGRFYGVFALGDKEEEEKYRLKKEKALESTEKTPMSSGQIKYRDQRDAIIYLLKKTSQLSYDDISDMLLDLDIDFSPQQLHHVCGKFGLKEEIMTKHMAERLKKRAVKNEEENQKLQETLEKQKKEEEKLKKQLEVEIRKQIKDEKKQKKEERSKKWREKNFLGQRTTEKDEKDDDLGDLDPESDDIDDETGSFDGETDDSSPKEAEKDENEQETDGDDDF